MKGIFIKLRYYLICFPSIIIFKTSFNDVFVKDIEIWKKIKNNNCSDISAMCFFLYNYREFRNIFFFRFKTKIFFLKILILLQSILLSEEKSLYIKCNNIFGGFYIQHGFSTIISAEKIGYNFWVSQQVTIGADENNKCPIIGNNVRIGPGAQIIGGIKIGNNVVIGPNSLVVKSLPDNCTVVSTPSYIVKKDGAYILKKLDNI